MLFHSINVRIHNALVYALANECTGINMHATLQMHPIIITMAVTYAIFFFFFNAPIFCTLNTIDI